MMWVVGMITLLPPLAIDRLPIVVRRGASASAIAIRRPAVAADRGAASWNRRRDRAPAIAAAWPLRRCRPDRRLADLVVLNPAERTAGFDLLRTPFVGRAVAFGDRAANRTVDSAVDRGGDRRRWAVWTADFAVEPGRRAAVDSLARAGGAGAAGGRQFFLHGLPFHAAASDCAALFESRARLARPGCDRNGWPWRCWSLSFGRTRCSTCGRAPGGRPGLRWRTFWWRSRSTHCFAARRFANMSVRWGSFSLCNRWSRRWRCGCATRRVCTTCRTHDCLRGGPQGRGCETDLFAPRKRGNLDCTFCLDCARACPTATSA